MIIPTLKQLENTFQLVSLEVDTSKESDYTPNRYTVDDREMDLEGVLDEIKETPSYSKTIDVVGNQWDEASKRIIYDQPAILKVINDQVQNGIFDQIMTVVEKERLLGKLNNVSDIEAYKLVGDYLQSQNAFAQPAGQPKSTSSVTPKTKSTSSDPKVVSKKKAASGTKKAPGSKVEQDFNPLSMSDEDFEKIAVNRY